MSRRRRPRVVPGSLPVPPLGQSAGTSAPGPAVAWGPGAVWAALGPVGRVLLGLGLAASLAALLAHSARYLFLTDDAFISFRYARNLSEGHGLVFNPGFEAVEGYSNFLYVLALALLHRLGLPPEAANGLSLAGTVALWATVAWFGLRRVTATARAWVALVPLFLLAATRSVAVWSSGGLETRWFEVLVVGGALRLVVEVEADLARRRRCPCAVWLFALATLTRPEGLMLSACALGTAGLFLLRSRRLDLRRFALELVPYLVLVGGHFLWRHAYYAYWLPNTYYAKVGGQLWWSLGLAYVAAFALEYAIYLWVPLLAAGTVRRVRQGAAFEPLLFAALVLPHLAYVTAVGGDHFEYRPLDLYFPFLYLLLAAGLEDWLERRPRLAPVAVACLVLVLAGVWELPAQSHRQFPQRYVPGFPGRVPAEPEGRSFLDPARSWLYRWPGARSIALAHRARVHETSEHFVGIRQEEHRMFLAMIVPDGRILRRAVERGLLPADTYLALGSVGAIPYYSDLRTLDLLGLTDAGVAHAPPARQLLMAHDRRASYDDVRTRGVDLCAEDVHLVYEVVSPRLLQVLGEAAAGSYSVPPCAADLGDGRYLVASLAQGREGARRRMPRLAFRPLTDSAFVRDFARQAIDTCRSRLRADPADSGLRFELASLLMLDRRFPEAARAYEDLARVMPDEPDLWANLALCRESGGDAVGAAAALRRAEALAAARADTVRLRRIREDLRRIETSARRPPG